MPRTSPRRWSVQDSYGLLDCVALGRAVAAAGGTIGTAGATALRAYQAERLEENRAHVHESLEATMELLRSVTRS
jgi:hypothetical protein